MDVLEGWRAGQRAWPDIDLDPQVFADFVGRHHSEQGASRQMRWKELYLTCACARGDANAIAAFERTYGNEIDKAAARIRGGPPADELRQVIREKLFVARPGEEPVVAEFSGWGQLRTWVRLAAARTALNQAQRDARQVPLDEDGLSFLIGSGDDPEVKYLRRLYSEKFRGALGKAFGELEPRERNLLRYALWERLTSDEIGKLLGVHRATAARWVGAAHETLAKRVKGALADAVGVTPRECSSILRMVESKLTISLQRYLGAASNAK